MAGTVARTVPLTNAWISHSTHSNFDRMSTNPVPGLQGQQRPRGALHPQQTYGMSNVPPAASRPAPFIQPTYSQTKMIDVSTYSERILPESRPENLALLQIASAMNPLDLFVLNYTEVFRFSFRPRLNHEPLISRSAVNFVQIMQSTKPALLNEMEYVVGFRCRNCKQATQLLHVRNNTETFVRALQSVQRHTLQCNCIPGHARHQIRNKYVPGHAYAPLSRFIDVWQKQLFTNLSRMMQQQNSTAHRTLPQSFVVNDPLRALPNSQHFAAPVARQMPAPIVNQVHPVRQLELDLADELDISVIDAFDRNNYGFSLVEPVDDLTELPSSQNVTESPYLELLLQCFTVIKIHDMSSGDPGVKTKIRCKYDDTLPLQISHELDTAQSTASFILKEGCDYLLQCDKAPESKRKHVVRLRSRLTADETQQNSRDLEELAQVWINHLCDTTEKTTREASRRRDVELWTTPTWSMIHKRGGAKLLTQPNIESVQLISTSDKQLQFVGRNDVVDCWDGDHVGNRQLLSLVTDNRTIYASATKEQRTKIAELLVQTVGKRKGRFLKYCGKSIPMKNVPMNDAVKLVMRVFESGFISMLYPPRDPQLTGRGCFVSDCEQGPQIGLLYGDFHGIRPAKRQKVANDGREG